MGQISAACEHLIIDLILSFYRFLENNKYIWSLRKYSIPKEIQINDSRLGRKILEVKNVVKLI